MSGERNPRTARHPARTEPQELPCEAAFPKADVGVRLACTMAAMIGLLGVFLAFVEKEDRLIRRYAVQSALLTAVHAAAALTMAVLCAVLGTVPYIGFLMTLTGWLTYIALLMGLIVQRARMMERAWRGAVCDLILLEPMAKRYYHSEYRGKGEP